MSTIGGGFSVMPMTMEFKSSGGLERPVDGREKLKAARLNKAVSEFEALFVNNMLKTMRTTIHKSGLLGKGRGGEIYTSLFDWEISKEMAAGGGLGLGRMLLKTFNHSETRESNGRFEQGAELKKKP